MKKLFVFAFAVLGVLACNERNAPNDSTNSKEISCEPSVIEFDVSQNGTKTITLTANGAWSATANSDWITIEPMSGQGSSFVKISTAAGPQAEGRIIFSTSNASAQVVVMRIDKYPGSFSIGTNSKVYFSSGNLQYNPSSSIWRFAECQYDIVGVGNENVSSDYNGWIDLFGWGTSGYNGVYPWTYKYKDGNGYIKHTYYCYHEDLDITGTQYDWGVYNAISNGGNQAGIWRTLTSIEWRYIFSNRPNAGELKGKASINNINGILIFPDGWQTPVNLTFSSSVTNKYNLAEWQLLEASGAIFLPYAGYAQTSFTNNEPSYVYHIEVFQEGKVGHYWTSDMYYSSEDAIYFDCSSFYTNHCRRDQACSVRLVKDVE